MPWARALFSACGIICFLLEAFYFSWQTGQMFPVCLNDGDFADNAVWVAGAARMYLYCDRFFSVYQGVRL